MKPINVKIEMTIDVEMGEVPTKYTSLKGYLPNGTSYRDIVRIFGKPQSGQSPDGKTKAEWIGKINGIVFTIYDYNSSIPPKHNTNWHIGGKIGLAAELVNHYFVARKKAIS